VDVVRRANDRLALISDRVTFDGATGEVLKVWKAEKPALLTYSVLIGLHYLWFDHLTIRWLYFLMGLMGSVMIATGLLLWVIKRKEPHVGSHKIYRIVETLNVAVIAGLPIAIAGFLWGNRLWPWDLPERATWEMRTFFFLWLLCFVHGFLRRDSVRAWREQLIVAATLFVLLPLLNVVTTGSHVFVTVPAGNWRLASVDLVCFITGALLFLIAWRIVKMAECVPTAITTSSMAEAGQG